MEEKDHWERKKYEKCIGLKGNQTRSNGSMAMTVSRLRNEIKGKRSRLPVLTS